MAESQIMKLEASATFPLHVSYNFLQHTRLAASATQLLLVLLNLVASFKPLEQVSLSFSTFPFPLFLFFPIPGIPASTVTGVLRSTKCIWKLLQRTVDSRLYKFLPPSVLPS